MWDERDDDYREEVISYVRCQDGLCGADDCPTCRPGNFTDGVWNEDIETTTIEDIETTTIEDIETTTIEED